MLYLVLQEFNNIETEFRQLAAHLGYLKLEYITHRKNIIIESTKNEQDLKTLLHPYFPANALEKITTMLTQYDIHFEIANLISTNYGGFFSPKNKIFIERTYNSIKILDVLLHEYAHFLCYKKFPTGYDKNAKTWIKSHGDEWLETYKELVFSFLEEDLFPVDAIQYYNDFFFNIKYRFDNLCHTSEFYKLNIHWKTYD